MHDGTIAGMCADHWDVIIFIYTLAWVAVYLLPMHFPFSLPSLHFLPQYSILIFSWCMFFNRLKILFIESICLDIFYFMCAANVPSLGRLIDGIQRKKYRESLVVAFIVAILLCFTIWYVFIPLYYLILCRSDILLIHVSCFLLHVGGYSSDKF